MTCNYCLIDRIYGQNVIDAMYYANHLYIMLSQPKLVILTLNQDATQITSQSALDLPTDSESDSNRITQGYFFHNNV